MRQVGVAVEAGFNRSGVPESALGNLFTSAMLETAGNADVAIHNNVGGIRADIPPGPLTYGSIYEIFPFDNRVVLLSISGADLRTVFENQLGNGNWRAGIAGIRLSAECRNSQLFVTMLRNDGRAVSDQEILLVATTDFLAIGGNNIFSPIMPPGGFVTDPSAPLFREKLAGWFERRGGVLRLTDFYEPTEARFNYPGEIPISCPGAT
jgi:5'-nucleotidase